MRKPNFENLVKVLNCEKPERPTLFEFILGAEAIQALTGEDMNSIEWDEVEKWNIVSIRAFLNGGYDFTAVRIPGFEFPKDEIAHGDSISLNDGVMIRDRKDFEKYPWPNPDAADYDVISRLEQYIPDGMKLVPMGPGGVLENVISLIGFENLCFMGLDDPELLQDVFDAVGSRLVKYYENCGKYDIVGAMVANDDWGFKTQTMLSPDDMRKYVIPWHKKIVEAIHSNGQYAILHSCGNLAAVMDDIIDIIGYDGKHSYEDTITPVEEAYEQWGGRIAILGGMDVDYLCRSTLSEINERSRKLLELSADKGGYALGSGNSIPDFVPFENYKAMIDATKTE